ncbi:ATP-binding cassette domain-containing protein [Cellulomonas sp. URHB0016]
MAADDADTRSVPAAASTSPRLPMPQAGGLQAESLTKSYGRRPILTDVSFRVPAGRSLAVVGANGCGKSTLLKICAGLVSPDSGTVRVQGRLGYCPQEMGLDGFLTADDHLAWFGRGRRLSRRAAVAEGGRIAAALDWTVPRRQQVRHLSGGTRQKLNVTTTMLSDPAVVLLDEPYQGFDHGSYLDFWGLVDQWCSEGRAVVIVTHMLHELNRVHDVLDLSGTEVA